MAKLAGNIAFTGNGFTVENQPAANAGAENQPHHQWILSKFIIPCFRKGKDVYKRQVKVGVSPEVNALATILLVLSLVMVIALSLIHI